MDEKLTAEQAKRLLAAIFPKKVKQKKEDDYPDTDMEKVDYAGYVLSADLEHIGKAINRLARLHHLLKAGETMENGLPPIIFQNELRMALEPMLRVRGGVVEITDMLLELYKPDDTQTKP